MTGADRYLLHGSSKVMILDLVTAPQGEVWHIVDKSCCSNIANNDTDGKASQKLSEEIVQHRNVWLTR